MKSSLTALLATLAVLFFVPCHLNAAAQDANDKRGVGARAPGDTNAWPDRTKRWALVIGVDEYIDGQISRLNGAANDARLLADALVSNAGFPPSQVVLLTSSQPASLQPRRSVILRYISNLRGNIPKDGLLLVAFAGHGIEREGKSFLLPSDAEWSNDVDLLEETAVEVGRVRDMIRASGVGQVVLILDACRNDPAPGRSGGDNPMSKRFAESFDFASQNRDIKAFATIYATDVGHRAYEYRARAQGYFTWTLVEGLKGAAANDRGEVTLASLIRYVQDNVPVYVRRDLGTAGEQRPYSVVEGYKADELVIAVAAKTANDPAGAAVGRPLAEEVGLWDRIKESGNAEDFKAYLREYPAGLFVERAQKKVSELTPRAHGLPPASAPPTAAPATEYEVNISRASTAYASQDWNSAITYAQQAIKSDPAQPRGYELLGTLLLYTRNDLAGAEQAMRAAIEHGGSAGFIVYHDHTGDFSSYCQGTMSVTKSGVSFKADNGGDTFNVEDSNIKEAKTNGWVGSAFGAFHIKVIQSINGRGNFNFAPNTRKKAEAEMLIRLMSAY